VTKDECAKWGLDPLRLPRHVAVIMDGNGRWATARHLPRLMGHKKGVERVREVTELAGQLGIETLTLYALSDENLKRPAEEVGGLMTLLRAYVQSDRLRLIENRVRFRMLGNRANLPSDVVSMIEDLERDTAGNSGLSLNVALSYGGHNEILRATRALMEAARLGTVAPEQLTADLFENHLYTAGQAKVDLLIRTSGEYRISNFLLWQIAYAEMVFESTLWPDFDAATLVRILKEFSSRERRFGLTSAQISARNGSSSNG
jgi:undecaprenyl diphosphate synthase